MNIRFANPSDIPAMIALLQQVGEVHHQIRPDLFRGGAQKYSETDLEELLKDESKPIFVADDGGFVAGYCFCQIRDYAGSTVQASRKELYIDDLCVDENRRGQHVGSVLYDHAVTFGKEIGCDFLTLNVWCGNDSAMAFYEKMGMTPRHVMMEMKL